MRKLTVAYLPVEEEPNAALRLALVRSTVLGALAAIERSGWTGFQQEQDGAAPSKQAVAGSSPVSRSNAHRFLIHLGNLEL